jgi:hypothetical protein
MAVDLGGAAYAASRISPTLKGSTKQFGWLQAIATASFLGPLRFNYQIAFAPLSQLFYMFAAPDEWGCVYSQSIYTGKLAKGL